MGDMLSQDEINALLGAVDDSGDVSPEKAEKETSEENNNLKLTSEEKDVLGEMGNISMGTSATTLFSLLNQKVQITTPVIKEVNWEALSKSYDRPFVGIEVGYIEGITGSNMLVLKETDVKIITNLMMGGTGDVTVNEPLNDIDLSAIGEAMNQMVGSSSTSLSSLLGIKIDINTPKAFLIDLNDDSFFAKFPYKKDDDIVTISFRMEIGTLIDSEIMQIIPLDFARELVDVLTGKVDKGTTEDENIKEETIEPKESAKEPEKSVAQTNETIVSESREVDMEKYLKQPDSAGENVSVKTAKFQDFNMGEFVQQRENIEIIKDVPLEVTVELGRTKKKIKEILEFSPGTIVELDKIAGEPINIMVNGKFVATGEVVVIDENFGVRITDIISVENRV